jgi:hypothetical protein
MANQSNHGRRALDQRARDGCELSLLVEQPQQRLGLLPDLA